MSEQCCELFRGEIFVGPAIRADGLGYDGSGWGANYGVNYGGVALAQGLTRPPLPSPLTSLGNASIKVTTAVNEVAGAAVRLVSGTRCKTRTIDSMSVELTLHCLKVANLARALGAMHSSMTGAAIANEVIPIPGMSASDGDLIAFARGPVDVEQAATIQVFNAGTNTVTRALSAGVDYVLTSGGAKLVQPIALSAGEVLRASYTALASDQYSIESLVENMLSLRLVAKNSAASNDVTKNAGGALFDFYRVKLYSATEYDILPDGAFTSFTLAGEIETVSYGGRPRYYSRTSVK